MHETKRERYIRELSGHTMIGAELTGGACREIVELLREQMWIPCSERLPEAHETVLITHKRGVSVGWHNGIYWERGASTNHRKMQTVIAWMPLPEPYDKAQYNSYVKRDINNE